MEHTPDDAAEIGRRLRALRRARGLKQQDLASEDISVSYVSLIETGKRTPSDAVLQTLADRVSCTVEYLRSGRDDTRARDLELKIAFADLAMRNGANGEALQAYSEAIASAPLLSQDAVRRARLGQALAMEKLGRLEAAIQLMTDLFEDGQSVAGSAQWTQLAVALCRCYREQGDQVLSVEIGENALKRLDQLGLDTTDDHIQLGATLIDCYRLRGDVTRAHLLAERLIDRADESGSRVARGSVYWNAALVAQSRGNAEEALALLDRALLLMAETDNHRHQSLLKAAYGQVLLYAGPADAERALELLTQAQQAVVEVGTAAEQAKIETYLAQARIQLDQPRIAQEHASRAVGLLRSEARWETAMARAVLAQAQLMTGEESAAEETLRSAAQRLRQVSPSRQTATVWRILGDLWQQHGHVNEALGAFRQAMDDAGLPSSSADHSVAAVRF